MAEETVRVEARRTQRVSLAAGSLIAIVRVYQLVLGPLMGGHCRFHPTCSHYAIDALREHGAMRGSWLALRRVLRCHPLSRGGFDPVPQKSAAAADELG